MKAEQKQFIERVGALAAADMQASGVLSSLTIAQAILESGWGTSELAQSANALFGIKADSRWGGKAYSKDTKECYDGVNYTTITALFRAYDSWEESVADHSTFLRAGSRYTAVIGEKDYKAACNSIKAAGYATAPDYAEKLISLIENYELTAYDGTTSKEEPVMKIYLSPSNQPHNAYTGVKTNEKAEMEAVAKKVKTILDNQYEAEAVMATLNLGIDYDERPSECKRKGCDFYLAIHSNAGGAGAAAGAVCFYHPNGKNAKALATALVKELDAICPVKSNRSSSVANGMNAFNGAGYGEIRSPMQLGVPSALVEVNFHDNATVAKWIVNNKDAVAAAIVRGIVSTFGIKKKSSQGGGTSPEQPEEKPGGGFSVGDLVRFKGGPHYTNANASEAASTPAAGPAKVTATAKGKHPYHLIHTDGTSSVYGWVDTENIEKVNTGGGGTSGSSTYTVKSGDCLSAIGAAIGVDWHEIASLNGITSPYTIYTGQVLKVPCDGAQAATWQEYTVKKGDSLWAIASKLLGNGSRYKEIKELSGLTSDTIYAGNVLKVPVK